MNTTSSTLTTTRDAVIAEHIGAVFTAFPDFEFRPERTHHAADSVIVEGRIVDMATSESEYFDHATMLGQINDSTV